MHLRHDYNPETELLSAETFRRKLAGVAANYFFGWRAYQNALVVAKCFHEWRSQLPELRARAEALKHHG